VEVCPLDSLLVVPATGDLLLDTRVCLVIMLVNGLTHLALKLQWWPLWSTLVL
jgi:hypothetical protein